jgi:hypothetical protein
LLNKEIVDYRRIFSLNKAELNSVTLLEYLRYIQDDKPFTVDMGNVMKIVKGDGCSLYRFHIKLVKEICESLILLNRSGFHHSDFEWHNILLLNKTQGGENSIKVIDFELMAKIDKCSPAVQEDDRETYFKDVSSLILICSELILLAVVNYNQKEGFSNCKPNLNCATGYYYNACKFISNPWRQYLSDKQKEGIEDFEILNRKDCFDGVDDRILFNINANINFISMFLDVALADDGLFYINLYNEFQQKISEADVSTAVKFFSSKVYEKIKAIPKEKEILKQKEEQEFSLFYEEQKLLYSPEPIKEEQKLLYSPEPIKEEQKLLYSPESIKEIVWDCGLNSKNRFFS